MDNESLENKPILLVVGSEELTPTSGLQQIGEYLTIGFTTESTIDTVLSLFEEMNIEELTYSGTTFKGYTELVELKYSPKDGYTVMLKKDAQKEAIHDAVSDIISELDLTDEQALVVADYYPKWAADTAYTAGQYVRYNGVLYKVLQDHTSQSDWTPLGAPSLFGEVLIGDPEGDEVPEWAQPDSTNAYKQGDVVMHNSITWKSLVDGNVWEPTEQNEQLGLWLSLD